MMTTVDLTREPLSDAFNRPITYLRVSVTDKCNLRCVYCMPESGLTWLRRDEVLSYEEIVEIVRAAARVGVRTIRLTGGAPRPEPLGRRHQCDRRDRRYRALDQRRIVRRAARRAGCGRTAPREHFA